MTVIFKFQAQVHLDSNFFLFINSFPIFSDDRKFLNALAMSSGSVSAIFCRLAIYGGLINLYREIIFFVPRCSLIIE